MSSEWVERSIVDVCAQVFSGGTPKSSIPEFFDRGSIPWLKTKEVNYSKIIETENFITELGLKNSSAKLVPINSVIVAMYGNGDTAGRVAINKIALTTNQACCNLVIDSARADYRFVYYYLQSQYAKLVDLKNGGAQQNLNAKLIKDYPIVVPSITEQREIGSFLESLDDRISLLCETNATLEDIAQALFKSWFVDFDPVHARARGEQPAGLAPEVAALFPDSFEESDLGQVPKGWSTGSLNDLALLNPESWTVKNRPDSVAYVDLANAKENEIAEITEFLFEDAPSRARRVLRDGDTIVGTVRPGNRSYAFISNPRPNLTGSTGFAVLRPKQKAATEYVYLAATANSSIEYLAHVADGGAYPAVRPEVVSNLPCVLPSYDVLNAFHAVAAPLFAKVAANHQQAQTLATLRDTLLPRLISGQLRLPDAEEQLSEAGLCQ